MTGMFSQSMSERLKQAKCVHGDGDRMGIMAVLLRLKEMRKVERKKEPLNKVKHL